MVSGEAVTLSGFPALSRSLSWAPLFRSSQVLVWFPGTSSAPLILINPFRFAGDMGSVYFLTNSGPYHPQSQSSILLVRAQTAQMLPCLIPTNRS